MYGHVSSCAARVYLLLWFRFMCWMGCAKLDVQPVLQPCEQQDYQIRTQKWKSGINSQASSDFPPRFFVMRLFNAIRPNTGIYLSLSSCPNLPLVYLIVGSFFPSQNFSRSCFIKQLDYPRARGKVAWSSRKELSETVATVKKLLTRIRRVVVLAN
jgi:hypothetical protein